MSIPIIDMFSGTRSSLIRAALDKAAEGAATVRSTTTATVSP